jgi:hypothetical protein
MMFVARDVLLDVAFDVARPRLVTLAGSRALVDASQVAYQEGLASPVRSGSAGPGSAGPGVGPAQLGPAPQLARVRSLAPVERADTVTVGLRWEARGVSAGLFPVLDADITLAAASEQTTTLTLSGVFRATADDAALLGAPLPEVLAPAEPAPGQPGDPALLADVMVRALLRYAADYLSGLIT